MLHRSPDVGDRAADRAKAEPSPTLALSPSPSPSPPDLAPRSTAGVQAERVGHAQDVAAAQRMRIVVRRAVAQRARARAHAIAIALARALEPSPQLTLLNPTYLQPTPATYPPSIYPRQVLR